MRVRLTPSAQNPRSRPTPVDPRGDRVRLALLFLFAGHANVKTTQF
jgi:hypothetical protein